MAYAKRVSDAEFVTKWMQCHDYEELIQALGMARCSIHARAVRLRNRGVKLPAKRERAKSNVDTLNDLIAKFTPPVESTKPTKPVETSHGKDKGKNR
jgi:hypothetical protein